MLGAGGRVGGNAVDGTADSRSRLIPIHTDGGRRVDKDRIKGAAHKAKGTLKEATGKVTGDTKTEVEGKVEKAAGKVQQAAGKLKDAARGK